MRTLQDSHGAIRTLLVFVPASVLSRVLLESQQWVQFLHHGWVGFLTGSVITQTYLGAELRRLMSQPSDAALTTLEEHPREAVAAAGWVRDGAHGGMWERSAAGWEG